LIFILNQHVGNFEIKGLGHIDFNQFTKNSFNQVESPSQQEIFLIGFNELTDRLINKLVMSLVLLRLFQVFGKLHYLTEVRVCLL
jgi:hypothetical protein